ncbi:hypothetical protein P4O66_002119 [Electrophorus voltai]|uniref:Reverse transcriptase domain-containing protein n=1 Tax=Electrophorus voltai TaxID=2609070 RepID=A0AAD8Z175_9TELE|nr:hypothetical protein P4O66_002119 [Electrophorus voltai]
MTDLNNVAAQNDQVLRLTAADVRRNLRGLNPRKAAGPDNILGRVLRECADQLADVLTDIFNISLSCAVVPTCFKTTTIIPVPKKPLMSCLNDYGPIALTSIIMKCFERLVMRHIKTQLLPSLDPLQFAYRSNRSTDDAISTTLHLALTHLDEKGTYVRMLFIDFSSAFNTIVPQHLIGKLSLLGLNTSLCNWILDFLTGRLQSVRIRSSTSNTTTLSTGAPQGSVLSLLLFTLLTHDCAAMHSSNHLIKFADDMTVVGLINKDNESAYREEVRELVSWCKVNNLYLNVDKTKEMVVDFRRARMLFVLLRGGNTTVLTMIDRFSRGVQFIAFPTMSTAFQTAEALFNQSSYCACGPPQGRKQARDEQRLSRRGPGLGLDGWHLSRREPDQAGQWHPSHRKPDQAQRRHSRRRQGLDLAGQLLSRWGLDQAGRLLSHRRPDQAGFSHAGNKNWIGPGGVSRAGDWNRLMMGSVSHTRRHEWVLVASDYKIQCYGEDFLMLRDQVLQCSSKVPQACYTRGMLVSVLYHQRLIYMLQAGFLPDDA